MTSLTFFVDDDMYYRQFHIVYISRDQLNAYTPAMVSCSGLLFWSWKHVSALLPILESNTDTSKIPSY